MSTALTAQQTIDARDRARRVLQAESAFATCSKELIDQIMEHSRVISLDRNEIMYRQGDKGDSMMVVVSGSLKVTNVTAEGKEVVLGFIKSGSLIGEIAALDGRERTAGVVALEKTEAVAIYRRDLLPLLRANPDAMFALMEGLCSRMRSTITLVESHTLEAAARIASCLVRLGREHGQRNGKSITIDLKLTQRDLGSHLGLTRETVSRTLNEFKDDGLIELGSSTIILHDQEKLADIADGLGG